MPVWHDATADLRHTGKVQLLGVIQEQHPERCKLFAQWKRFDWPILVDSLNQLEVSVVPIALLIDEQGVVRSILRDPQQDVGKLTAEFDSSPGSSNPLSTEPRDEVRTAIDRARDLVAFNHEPKFSDAIRSVEQELTKSPRDGRLHFALGTLYRGRYDGPERQPQDFQRAIDHWQRALDIDPNQYIWRRRIQQYGPPSDKPYPFYDWVEDAHREITARGDVPVALAVDLTVSELAKPLKISNGDTEAPSHPDPEGRITRDDDLIITEMTLVPPQPRAGEPVHAYVSFRPDPRLDAHWNNESDPMMVYLDLPVGWSADKKLVALPAPGAALTDESRTVEFDLVLPQRPADIGGVHGFALYGVCRGATGECLYRRRNFDIQFAQPPLGPK